MTHTPSYRLRRATPADQSTIRTIVRAHRLNPLGLKWTQFVLAVTSDDTIVGCGQVKPHGDGSYELGSIAVIPSWRHQGIATTIINHLQDSHTTLWLTCASRLVPFYHKAGFVEVRTPIQMPPYFRRIYRLSQWIVQLVKTERYLAVMVWKAEMD